MDDVDLFSFGGWFPSLWRLIPRILISLWRRPPLGLYVGHDIEEDFREEANEEDDEEGLHSSTVSCGLSGPREEEAYGGES
jgi:hypothetical protein